MSVPSSFWSNGVLILVHFGSELKAKLKATKNALTRTEKSHEQEVTELQAKFTRADKETRKLRGELQASDFGLMAAAELCKLEVAARAAARPADAEVVDDTVLQLFERGKFTTRARIIGFTLLHRGVAARELGAAMRDLAPLYWLGHTHGVFHSQTSFSNLDRKD